jgi:phosphopantothenoylcysteine decarboxylase/phosphopantothenate--cysteine ligase
LYDEVASVKHVELGQSADLVVVAPATANSIAQMAIGLAPNLLGNVVLATRGHVVVAPAMHTEMWSNEATRENIARLRSRGVTVVGPDSGALTGDDAGVGRMAEPSEIVAVSYAALSERDAASLEGRRILISGGGTREPIDPVRFIGNRSSGAQAVALARAAQARGAQVTFVYAHLDVDVPIGIEAIPAVTAAQMLEEMLRLAPDNDVVIMAAAVADYRVDFVSDEKLKKSRSESGRTLTLVETTDVLSSLAAMPERSFTLVGFAAETERGNELLALAREKLQRKGCDVIVANEVSWSTGIGTTHNEVTILKKNASSSGSEKVVRASGDKLSVAHRILDVLV